MAESKQDRELIELLNELRVALPGVQVLFAFMLAVPFSVGFTKMTEKEVDVFFFSFMMTAVATAFLMAPSSFHRIRWRDNDKEALLRISNKLAIIGMVCLALAMGGVVWV